jgi:hypothetical protein
MKLSTAMAVTKILVQRATGVSLDEWKKDGHMFSSKTLALAFKVISGKAKYPNLVKAFSDLKNSYQASTHCVVAFSKDEDIEPIICMKFTTFLKYLCLANESKNKVMDLRAEILNMEYETGRSLGQI